MQMEIKRKPEYQYSYQKKIDFKYLDFLGGAVVKNLPANAGNTGLILGPGRFHMPQSN